MAFYRKNLIVKKKVFYEQPLNEKTRQLLRLEHLFEGVQYWLASPAQWDTRALILVLLEILEILTRTEWQTELSELLDQQKNSLLRWQNQPNVDNERLERSLSQLKQVQARLATIANPFPTFSQHLLFNTLKQRQHIAGGTAKVDMPNYHFWLNRHFKERQVELLEWLTPFEPIREALELNLYLLRQNSVVSQEIAEQGFFQSTVSTPIECPLIRVALPYDAKCYPEINSGKQRFTIRFVEYVSFYERAAPLNQTLNFELACCML